MNPCTMSTYCRALDHAIEYCPQLILKWQERGNQNQNQNQNLQMIAFEEHNDQPRVAVFMRGGMRTGADATEKGKGVEKWIRNVGDLIPAFNP
jgi:hypothetical protein